MEIGWKEVEGRGILRLTSKQACLYLIAIRHERFSVWLRFTDTRLWSMVVAKVIKGTSFVKKWVIPMSKVKDCRILGLTNSNYLSLETVHCSTTFWGLGIFFRNDFFSLQISTPLVVYKFLLKILKFGFKVCFGEFALPM